jgi:hypothetical protein
VKWILLSVIGMLAVGFALLYRKGDPMAAASAETEKAAVAASTKAAPAKATSTKASGHARGGG